MLQTKQLYRFVTERENFINGFICRMIIDDQDLDVLGCIGSSEQRQPAQHTGEQQIGTVGRPQRAIMLRGLRTLTARLADGEGAGQRP